jgi:hypothetical protein
MRLGDCRIQHGQASSQYPPNMDRPNFAGKQFSGASGSVFLLNTFPFQTKVALDRIATYLDEDEVDEQVSSLKRSRFGTSVDDDTTKGLGIENGTFKWNEVEQKDDVTANTAKSVASTPIDNAVQGADDETERSSLTGSVASNHRFELRDVNIMFPERQLTVVTGPTASGKTALLVSLYEHPHQKSC